MRYIHVIWVTCAMYSRGQICCFAVLSEAQPHSPPSPCGALWLFSWSNNSYCNVKYLDLYNFLVFSIYLLVMINDFLCIYLHKWLLIYIVIFFTYPLYSGYFKKKDLEPVITHGRLKCCSQHYCIITGHVLKLVWGYFFLSSGKKIFLVEWKKEV